MNLRSFVRSIPDFPKPGIMFRDITPILASAAAMRETIHQLAKPWQGAGITKVVAAEARGFVFGAPLALELEAGFVPVRKPGKLPWQTHRFSYDLEYGSDCLEIHTDAIAPGDRVLLIDDLLATGGTIEACLKLAQQQQAEIAGAAFVIELAFLNGRARLSPIPVHSLLTYHTESPDE
jgi:adenine phosphoribosyltransferase